MSDVSLNMVILLKCFVKCIQNSTVETESKLDKHAFSFMFHE